MMIGPRHWLLHELQRLKMMQVGGNWRCMKCGRVWRGEVE